MEVHPESELPAELKEYSDELSGIRVELRDIHTRKAEVEIKIKNKRMSCADDIIRQRPDLMIYPAEYTQN